MRERGGRPRAGRLWPRFGSSRKLQLREVYAQMPQPSSARRAAMRPLDASLVTRAARARAGAVVDRWVPRVRVEPVAHTVVALQFGLRFWWRRSPLRRMRCRCLC